MNHIKDSYTIAMNRFVRLNRIPISFSILLLYSNVLNIKFGGEGQDRTASLG